MFSAGLTSYLRVSHLIELSRIGRGENLFIDFHAMAEEITFLWFGFYLD